MARASAQPGAFLDDHGGMANEPDPTDGVATLAVDLGWRLAQLYDSKELPGPRPPNEAKSLPPHLPGLGEMSPFEKACALAAHVEADLAVLGTALGSEMPSAEPIQTALGLAGHSRDDVRQVVHKLFLAVRDQLAGTSPAAAVAFGLGRMLADTTLLPTSDVPDVLGELFQKYRLSNAFDWLDDLDSALPPDSASAVRVSLRAWEEWVEERRQNGTLDPTKIDAMSIRALHRQGDLWRRLLTGEKPAAALLNSRAYVGAAASLIANGRRLAFDYLWKWCWAIALALIAVTLAIRAAVVYAPAGTDRVAAILVTAAGFLGVSWTGIRATLGRALRQAEGAMWDAEVAAAIGKAATILPKAEEDRPEPPVRDEPAEDDGAADG